MVRRNAGIYDWAMVVRYTNIVEKYMSLNSSLIGIVRIQVIMCLVADGFGVLMQSDIWRLTPRLEPRPIWSVLIADTEQPVISFD